MKVISKTINSTETSVEIDLFEGMALTRRQKDEIIDQVGNFLVDQTLVHMNEKKSPVQGEGSFKALSKDYKKKKLEEVGSGEANLEFDGIMKDEISFIPTKNGIEIGVFGERAGAADGHNNLSGKSQLPTRRFLPDEGQNYKRPIQQEVSRIIADVVAETTPIKKSNFRGIETKAELYDNLKNIFGDMTRSELRLSVFRNEKLTNILQELNLIDLL